MLFANFPLGEVWWHRSQASGVEEVTVVEVVVQAEMKKKKSHPYMPRTWRWVGLKQVGKKSLVKSSIFAQMSILLVGLLHLVYLPSATRRLLSHRDILDHLAIAIATIIAPILLPSKTEFDEAWLSIDPKSPEAVGLKSGDSDFRRH